MPPQTAPRPSPLPPTTKPKRGRSQAAACEPSKSPLERATVLTRATMKTMTGRSVDESARRVMVFEWRCEG